jgi:hypothetical protein
MPATDFTQPEAVLYTSAISLKCPPPAQRPADGAMRKGTTRRRLGSAGQFLMACCLLTGLLVGVEARAYPPSPYHLIYGLVRDQYGTPLLNDQVQVLMVSTTGTRNSTTVQPGLAVGLNYQLQVPMDALLKPDLYRSNALAVSTGFKLYVVVGNTTNVPIVSAVTTTNLGQPTKMTRIDLTLGTDSNGDGIPDEWELQFLASLGANLSLADLNAGMDLAHDGRTLLQEYLLGTAVFDPDNPFAVRLVDYNGGGAVLEFPTMTGRSYTVLGSSNLQQWAVLPFRLTAEGAAALTRTNFTSSAIDRLQVQVLQSGPAPKAQFFRISLQ